MNRIGSLVAQDSKGRERYFVQGRTTSSQPSVFLKL
jgi:hypothetical protein